VFIVTSVHVNVYVLGGQCCLCACLCIGVNDIHIDMDRSNINHSSTWTKTEETLTLLTHGYEHPLAYSNVASVHVYGLGVNVASVHVHVYALGERG
jgi:hypothetical protein